MDEGSGFRVNDRKVGDRFKLITKKYIFDLIVVNPEAQEVIILSDEEGFRKPQIFYLEGANWRGSLVKIGYVLTGSHVKFRSFSEGGFGLLPIIQDFAEFDGNVSDETKAIIAKAEESRPREATPAEIEEVRQKFWEAVDKRDWGEHKEAVKKMIEFFCFINGQAYIFGILDEARKADKMAEALKLLDKQCDEHWGFRPPQLRGEIITGTDEYYLRTAYAELGLKPPGQKD